MKFKPANGEEVER